MRHRWVPLTGWRLHVRCDDPDNQCICATDPTSSTYALTINRDRESGLARINFCQPYFELPSLGDVIKDGQRAVLDSQKFDLTEYQWNKGEMLSHASQ